MRKISVRGASEHNLKHIDLDIPHDSLSVITGLSGSGKSSLAFDTIFKEGQRRYVESLSAYARQFLGQMERPHVDHIEGLAPAAAIDQRAVSRNPRSTVGTITEISDYLRLLFARIGHVHCHRCGTPIEPQTADNIVEQLIARDPSVPTLSTITHNDNDFTNPDDRVCKNLCAALKAMTDACKSRGIEPVGATLADVCDMVLAEPVKMKPFVYT